MSTPQLDKTYNWSKLEERWYQHWLDKKYFQGKTDSNKSKSSAEELILNQIKR